MAREHGRVLCSIWRDPNFQERSPGAQRLYVLLLSQHELNNAGLLPLTVKRWSRGSVHTSIEDIATALHELADHRYVVVDEDTEEVLVRSLIRNDGVVKQPNVWKNALRCAEVAESASIRLALATELRRMGRQDADKTATALDPEGVQEPVDNPVNLNPSGTPREPFGNPSRQPAGKGKGKGKGYLSVGGDLRDAREEHPPLQQIDRTNPRCADHSQIPALERGPNCGACARAKESIKREEADEDQARRVWARTRIDAIAACGDCDEAGWRPAPAGERVMHCDHRPAPARAAS